VQLGVACAALLRSDGHNPSPYTERAASVICGRPAERVAEMARRILTGLRQAKDRPDVTENPYDAFREALKAGVAAPPAAPESPRQSLSVGV
jgi:hypothetical protein